MGGKMSEGGREGGRMREVGGKMSEGGREGSEREGTEGGREKLQRSPVSYTHCFTSKVHSLQFNLF